MLGAVGSTKFGALADHVLGALGSRGLGFWG